MNGSNLRDIVNLHIFKNFGKPEFHLYDQDDYGTYATQINEVNYRSDGSIALQTKKRYMESYIHAEAIRRVKGVTVVVNDTDDYIEKLCSYLKVKASVAKAILAEEVSRDMTVFEIDDRDGQGEIRSWLKTLAEMTNSSNVASTVKPREKSDTTSQNHSILEYLHDSKVTQKLNGVNYD
jgi:hypothetical protein